MLRPEEAEKQLKAFEDTAAKSKLKARMAQLPEALREAAYAQQGLTSAGEAISDYQKSNKREEIGIRLLHELSDAERRQIFDALFPEVSEYVDLAWNLLQRLPYEMGYERKAFRAPNTSEVYHIARKSFLASLQHTLKEYPHDILWLAKWAPYIEYYGAQEVLATLFAAAIDAGGETGEAVFEILLASARGEHEIGAMGRHVVRALMISSRPEGWDFLEKMLLAAQRQEGLRQSILESVDEGHPEAFRRMLRLIRENDLIRFSSLIRAVDVWFGFAETVDNQKAIKGMLAEVEQFLENPEARQEALATGNGQTAFLALWTIAFEDASTAIPAAQKLLSDPNPERRFAAVHLLDCLSLSQSHLAAIPAIEDPDLRVATAALTASNFGYDDYGRVNRTENEFGDAFERLERALPNFPRKERELEPIIWPWMKQKSSQQEVTYKMLNCLGSRSPKRLIPYLSLMSSWDRSRAAELLGKLDKSDAEVRQTLFTLVGDAASDVRSNALTAIRKLKINDAEAQGIEQLLTRKASDLRKGVLTLLIQQEDKAALTSTERLLASSNPLQRTAGLEIAQKKIQAEKMPDAFREKITAYREKRTERTEVEERLLDALSQKEHKEWTLDDALGLVDPTQRTKPTTPRALDVTLETDVTAAILKSLEDLIDKNREIPIFIENWQGERIEVLLGNCTYGLPQISENKIEQDIARLPLYELWEDWWQNREPLAEKPLEKGTETTRPKARKTEKALRDPDGMELIRAFYALTYSGKKFRHPYTILRVIEWLLSLHPPVGAMDFLLDATEYQLTTVPPDELAGKKHRGEYNILLSWREGVKYTSWLQTTLRIKKISPLIIEGHHSVRLYGLLRWIDEPGTKIDRYFPNLPELLEACIAGGANEHDVIDHLIGPRLHFHDLGFMTSRKAEVWFEKRPELRPLVEKCRERVIEVELNRGDLATPASRPAASLTTAGGMDTLVRIFHALGKEPMARGGGYGYYYGSEDAGPTRTSVFSHLIQVTFPAPDDTPQVFMERVNAAKIPQKRLVELAVFAPQWAKFVEYAIQWPELADAVWWIHAHTKDAQWNVDAEMREHWNRQTSERTPLSAQSLIDGAVDVAWFLRVYAALGAERWAVLDEAAKYASGGGGHKRAQLFADAMLGRVTKAELLSRITSKRTQEAMRALGLLPLPTGDEEAIQNDILERYQTMQEFLRTGKQFGAQRQANEKLAVSIGMENLARTAGYPDPVRLEWAMEARAIADLAEGSLSTNVKDVTVTLSINPLGEPDITITKEGKEIKAVPAALKKEESIVALMERKRDVQRQTSRMRRSLEEAMCRGDLFTAREIQTLFAHPVLAPMLRSLIFIGEAVAGYPVHRGHSLEKHDGSEQPLSPETSLRIAHSYDLLHTGEWSQWQRDCFLRERIQPFKQVFRELYVPTEMETTDGTLSRRYTGHQVNPRQAMALLGSRGWVNVAEEGVRRTFHHLGLVAWLGFNEYFTTPAEVEGLTIEEIRFTKRDDWNPIPLSEIPPRVFSEVMRDVDLVVSVAHQGGVDPEASASTIEMRTTLIRETCALLKIENVRLQSSHALIDGQLATYSVHLGSAVVHRQPGGFLCIVPVHGQHRGRLFLPFVDDDPRSAEALSKVLLLAKDSEIKDPTILEQILPAR